MLASLSAHLKFDPAKSLDIRVTFRTSATWRSRGGPSYEQQPCETSEVEQSSTALGSWYATALFWKPQVALFVNESTLVPVLMPLAPAATVIDRFPAALATLPEALGLRLAQTPCGPLFGRHGSPDRELAALTAEHLGS